MNIHQNRIIKTTANRAEVQASPGSGKTDTLIKRLQHLHSTGVSAEQILVLSFSNSTVNEIRRRLGAVNFSKELSKATVCTAHSFANRFVKKRPVSDKQAELMLGRAIRLVQSDCKKRGLWPDDSPDIRQRKLMLLRELSEPFEKKLVLHLLAVCRASRRNVADALNGQFESLKRYARVLRAIRKRYSFIKKENGAIDYADMLVQSVKAMEHGAKVPFTHILVDEYQDCSAAQTYLLAQLGKQDGRSIMVFGDSFQGIFGFAGAGYTPLYEVLDGVQKLSLPTSWRLTTQTAALASAVARQRAEKAIKTRREGELPVLVTDDTQAGQTKHILHDIQRLIKDGTPPEQIVVLARLKALLHPVEQLLRAHNVETNRMNLTRNRVHAQRVLRLVRIVERCETGNKEVLPEMINEALRRLTDIDDTRWKKAALNLQKVLRISSLEGRYGQCAKIYLQLKGGVRADKELRYDVNRWVPFCRDFQNVKAMSAAIRAMPAEGVVTGTIHAAKGREWNHVLIVGATDGLLPIHFAKDKSSLNQERNMLYVAITRACKTVRLYHAPSLGRYGQFDKVSRFLDTPAAQKTLKIE